MLTWKNNRWHCGDQPIHAGQLWLLICPEGELLVRIESEDRGRRLVAYKSMKGRTFTASIDPETDTLKPFDRYKP